MLQKKNTLFEFEGFRLDVAERRLQKGNDLVALAPKVFDLLVVLVENRGRLLDKAFLLQTLWPGSFVEEANLAVNISTLRKALGEPTIGGRLIETVPTRGYRFVGSVTEILPEPVVPEETAIRHSRSMTSYLAIALFAGVAVGSVAVWLISGRTLSLGGVHKIAVLPFSPLNSDPSQNYVGLGMADALITRLSRLQRIVVTPTSSVIRFENRKESLQEIGRELQVDAVLDGRVQQYDRRIRLTVNLLSVRDGRTLWADSFDDVFTNIFAVQDSISEKVATALAMKLTGSERQWLTKHTTTNTEAYSLYMQGKYEAEKRTAEGTLASLGYFKRAIEKDPEYAAAYAALAFAYITRASWGWGDEQREQAKAAARKALALDNQLPEAHLALGQVLMRGDWDWRGAAAEFDRAVEIDPNSAAARAAQSILNTALSRRAEAAQEMELACRLDPSSAYLRSDLAWTYNYQRNFREALKNAQKAVELGPNMFTPHRELNKAYLFLGRYTEALQECRTGLQLLGGHSRRVQAEIADIYAQSGQPGQAEAILAKLLEPDAAEPEPTYAIGVVQAGLGHKDVALGFLEKAVDHKMVQAIWMNADPELDALRGDQRYQDLVRRAGLLP
jgi:TolB-like protein/DNA-binding winged helix-turn-helix (wHTH) protein/tetratricopeptide (TPR) repeat protein